MIPYLRLIASVSCLLPAALCAEAVAVEDSGSDDGIAETIRTRNALRTENEQTGLLEQWHAFNKQAREAMGLDAVFTYDALAMGAMGNDASWGNSAGDATLSVRWQINSDASESPLSLNMRVRHRHAYSDLAPSQLRQKTDALWGYVDGFTDAGFEVPEIYFEDKLFDQRLTMRYGQMAIDDLMDSHRLRSAKRSFLNQAFSSSPAVGFPGSGLGFVAQWESTSGWDLTLGISNLESSNQDDSAKWRLKSDAMFEGVQFGYSFTGLDSKPARVQLLGWNADALPEAGMSSGRGMSLTLEQKWGERGRSFLRYAWSDGEAAATTDFVTAGIALDLRKTDRLGLSFAHGTSTSNAGASEGVIELFYRRRAGPNLHITPDVQFAFGDGIGGDSDWLMIVGVRVGFAF
jgi:porin